MHSVFLQALRVFARPGQTCSYVRNKIREIPIDHFHVPYGTKSVTFRRSHFHVPYGTKSATLPRSPFHVPYRTEFVTFRTYGRKFVRVMREAARCDGWGSVCPAGSVPDGRPSPSGPGISSALLAGPPEPLCPGHRARLPREG